MAVKIRLARHGKIRAPHYRIVVADSRTHRDGRVIEEIGRYVPTEHPSIIEVNSERAQYWLGVGAQPTEQVAALLKLTGDYQAAKGDKTAKNVVQTKEAKAAFVADTAKKPVLQAREELVAKKAKAAAEAAEAEEAAAKAAAAAEAAANASAEEAPAAEAAAEEAAEVAAEEAADVVAAAEEVVEAAEAVAEAEAAAPAEEA
ncbi:MAG: 30S ribosomal protein S16 [Micrococcales bacterium]